MIAIIDYGIGNVGSIQNMLLKAGAHKVVLAHTPEEIAEADKLILPGVGSFDMGMQLLNESGMRQELDRQVLEKKKIILGICLGMQMMGNQSEEGGQKGLGYIQFECKKFQFTNSNLKIPHMGWDYVETCQPQEKIVRSLGEHPRFYFVHSYFAVCKSQGDVLMTCDYGKEFAAAVHCENIYGMQFHPEKSHKYGMQIFENLIKEM